MVFVISAICAQFAHRPIKCSRYCTHWLAKVLTWDVTVLVNKADDTMDAYGGENSTTIIVDAGFLF